MVYLCFYWIGLEKSELIGDVGSRSFYLRKCCSGHSSNGTSPSTSEIALPRENCPPPIPPPAFLLPSVIARKINKIFRRARRLWKLLVCLQWGWPVTICTVWVTQLIICVTLNNSHDSSFWIFSPFLFRTKVPVLSYSMYIIPNHTLIICCANCCNSHCKFKIQKWKFKAFNLDSLLFDVIFYLFRSPLWACYVSMTNFQIFFFSFGQRKGTQHNSRVIFSHPPLWSIVVSSDRIQQPHVEDQAVEIMAVFRFEPKTDSTWLVDWPKRDPLLSKLRNHCSHSTK